jgi:hypothetical protein
MSKQITEVPMKKKAMGYMKGGKVKSGSPKRGYAKGGKVDQMACSPRKQMAMKGMK